MRPFRRPRAPPTRGPALPPPAAGKTGVGATAGPGAASDQSNNFKMPGGARISFNGVDSSLSSLKNCQSYINTGMDIATHVALDLVESFNDVEDVNTMENVMLEYAAMDRELNHYMRAIEETVNQIKREKPENIPDLKNLVKEKFTALESTNSDSDLQRNEKYMYFKDQLKEMRKQFRHQLDNDEAIEQIDEDIAVTQSQMNFICPITQMEMKRPVRNKVCGHIYEEDAILKIIQNKKQQKKKVRCPKIGCSHSDVKESDLMPDEALKRAIDSQNKQSWSTLEKSDGYAAATKICY
ncbi:E3 SUMO-protein ligase NSE2 isoform X2 [Melanerpes formicivorus]|uniref:E3 SUMO-protein ligase NSE2 isoform X2 n=1 Tax=Melanerpes formicivorus TaxID=211600 RepID=UPI00358E1CC0